MFINNEVVLLKTFLLGEGAGVWHTPSIPALRRQKPAYIHGKFQVNYLQILYIYIYIYIIIGEY